MSPPQSVGTSSPPDPPPIGYDGLFEPQWLPICCLCGLIRDDATRQANQPAWSPLSAYRRLHHLNAAPVYYTHTYCPTCLPRVQEQVRLYFEQHHTPR